ncbi:hypothetical protein GCM10023317_41300 [Actinopolymorpha pittospori]
MQKLHESEPAVAASDTVVPVDDTRDVSLGIEQHVGNGQVDMNEVVADHIRGAVCARRPPDGMQESPSPRTVPFDQIERDRVSRPAKA